MGASAGAISLQLLGGFEGRCDGRRLELQALARRVVALLALYDRPLSRSFVGGCLWPESAEEAAAACLRTTLWRLRRRAPELVSADAERLCLGGVDTDLGRVKALGRRTLAGETLGPEERAVLLSAGDVLPDWDDDWVVFERELFRQLRLHALERLCEQLTAAHRYAEAVESGLAAVAAEPLRESAHRVVARLHLAEGNRGEAVRQYEFFRRLLDRELGLRPSTEFIQLVGGHDDVTQGVR